MSHCVLLSDPEKFESDFINSLEQMSQCYGMGVLFPTTDETLVTISKNKERLKKFFKVSCPDWGVVKSCIEKKYTYELASKNGVLAPRTIIPKSKEDIDSYINKIKFPCLVKPSQSHLFFNHFKKKMFSVNDSETLKSVYKMSAQAGIEVMLQEIVSGGDCNVVNYNAYFIDGKPVAEFTAQHIRNSPPLFGSPRVVLSKKIAEVIEPGRNILKLLNYNGYACVEFKKDDVTGAYSLMEVNARHNLSTILAVKCGINFPFIHYQHLMNDEFQKAHSFKEGVYWIEIVSDFASSVKYFFKEMYSPFQYLRPYFKPKVYATFDFSDSKPFKRRITNFVKRLVTIPQRYFFNRKK